MTALIPAGASLTGYADGGDNIGGFSPPDNAVTYQSDGVQAGTQILTFNLLCADGTTTGGVAWSVTVS